MHRRTAALVVLVAAFALMLPTVAIAAGASLRSPSDGVVSSPTTLEVRVSRDAFEAISAIDVSLRRGDAAVEGSSPQRVCEGLRDCPNDARTADYRFPFDPRTGAPFTPEGTSRILANGPYELRVSIQVGRSTQHRALPLTLSVPPASPRDVRASVDDQQVTVQWGRGSEPDVSGYRIERSRDRGGWESAGSIGAAATSFVDEPGPGSYRYRVVVLRPDGKGGTYEVTSREVDARIAAPPAPDPTEDPDRSGDSGGDGGDDGGGDPDGDDGADGGDRSDGGGDGDGPDTDDEASAGGPSGDSSSGSAGRRTTRSTAQAPTFGRGASTPDLPWDDPEYFRESLDYDDPVTAERGQQAEDDGEVVLSVPGMGMRGGGGVDGSAAAVPIAGGLLMTAMGLHLWRWLKVPLP